jgi:hypothetical protein
MDVIGVLVLARGRVLVPVRFLAAILRRVVVVAVVVAAVVGVVEGGLR